jgi:serine/threonine protein kinase
MEARNQRWSERQVLELFLGLCKGLAVLHSHSPPLVHRDLKVRRRP